MSLKRFIRRDNPIPIFLGSDNVERAIQSMIDGSAGAVLIADDRNLLTGIFTERDVMTRITVDGLDPGSVPLSEVMTVNPVRCQLETPIEEAIAVLRKHRIRHLPVVSDSNEILGMISLRKLLHDQINELMEELQRLESYFNDSVGG